MPQQGNNHILFPHAGEHYSPFLCGTMDQVIQTHWNTSKATSAKATVLVCDTICPFLPVAFRRHFAIGTLLRSHSTEKTSLENTGSVSEFKNMKAAYDTVSFTFIKLSKPLQLCIALLLCDCENTFFRHDSAAFLVYTLGHYSRK